MTSSPERLIAPVLELYQRALALEGRFRDAISQTAPDYRESARNLLHYLALRQMDIRDLQDELASLGLSSLGRSEAHTLHTLESVLLALHRLVNREPRFDSSTTVDFKRGRALLHEHTRRLFGPLPASRSVRIMVTMPSEAAHNPGLVCDLLASGMDIMRINCAHDGPDAWLRMIENLRHAERQLGKTCKVCADLAGPKLRTGPLATTARVIKLRPQRDIRGRVTKPAQVWFVRPGQRCDESPAVPLVGETLDQAQPGDAIALRDARGRYRVLKVVSRRDAAVLAECDRTIYLETGMPVNLLRNRAALGELQVGELPAISEPLLLRTGDQLIMTNDNTPGQPAVCNPDGEIIRHAHIGCSIGPAFAAISPGQTIWFDDGKIGGRVLTNDGQQMLIEITQTSPASGAKLGAEKGVNVPGVHLDIPAITDKDMADLRVVAPHVDMIGLSFVRSPSDFWALRKALDDVGASHVGVILKIETRLGFENLPRLLLAGLQAPPIGVMVARGDLAVEVGFERLAEVQEEILWLCEAAHLPVIWATQVLESMAKTGSPSRAEVSDAVMSGRAECVMLNKGAYIVEAVRFLRDVLERMETHQFKKRSRFRRLAIAQLD
jgi:pyruvate kinase